MKWLRSPRLHILENCSGIILYGFSDSCDSLLHGCVQKITNRLTGFSHFWRFCTGTIRMSESMVKSTGPSREVTEAVLFNQVGRLIDTIPSRRSWWPGIGWCQCPSASASRPLLREMNPSGFSSNRNARRCKPMVRLYTRSDPQPNP
jgi:hypothetical protein